MVRTAQDRQEEVYEKAPAATIEHERYGWREEEGGEAKKHCR